MNKQQIGVIGLGVMGKNLALNIENKGFSVSVYDAWSDKVDEVKRAADAKQIACFIPSPVSRFRLKSRGRYC